MPAQKEIDSNDVPMIGAEIFIEPGQTQAEIENWFRILAENGMVITRIRLFENYMYRQDGSWDFTLFDYAFEAAEKYNIKIYGNLFPATDFTDVGGFKFPKSDDHLKSIRNYIQQVANHFKQYKSLYGWVPINEPGNGGIPNDTFSKNCLANWKSYQQKNEYDSYGYEHFDFADERFLVYYNNWFLQWLIKEIHLHDPARPMHVNNHDIFLNASEYDFPEWRKFLTSLGGSAHASWHFQYFTRQQYALAIHANSEMLRSGAGNIPWLMTELQGGNNTYSGKTPLCPTKEEIAQWLWITVATGSKGSIFWCLNPRSSGIEAGEWSMLDYQDNPSDRMTAASTVAKVINDNAELFRKGKVVESGISVLYTRESMWVEKKLQMPYTNYEGRETGGVMKSALAYFQVITEMGLQCNFREIGEYDFSADDYSGKIIILSHQISIASKYWPLLDHFVANGGKLIADGLTAYYDENAYCLLRKFPLQKIFGGALKEVKVAGDLFELNINGQVLLAHLWQGNILPTTGIPIATSNREITGVRNKYGRGEVFWVPSLLGMGARISADFRSLADILSREVAEVKNVSLVFFKDYQSSVIMKTLLFDDSFITFIINKSGEAKTLLLDFRQPARHSNVLFANKGGTLEKEVVKIEIEETLVFKWDV